MPKLSVSSTSDIANLALKNLTPIIRSFKIGNRVFCKSDMCVTFGTGVNVVSNHSIQLFQGTIGDEI